MLWHIEFPESQLTVCVSFHTDRMRESASEGCQREEMVIARGDGHKSGLSNEDTGMRLIELEFTHFSPLDNFSLGVTSTKSTSSSSPHSQPVPHHGVLEGVGTPAGKFCFNMDEDRV